MTPRYDLAHLTDEELLGAVARLNQQCNEALASLLAHLAEVERRQLHLRFGHASLFAYCTERLGLSEAEAFLRICAARAAAAHPELLGMIADGTMHLSGIKLLSPHLDGPEAKRLIAAARGKSKRAIEELVPSVLPEPRAAQAIRKLPERRAVPAAQAPATGMAACGTGSLPLLTSKTPGLGSAPPPATVGTRDVSQPPVAPGPTTPLLAPASSPVGPAAPASDPAAAQGRYQLHVVVGASVRQKLRQAQELLRHRVPDGDLGVVLERALDLLIAQQKKQRFGAGARPRRAVTATEPSASAPLQAAPEPAAERVQSTETAGDAAEAGGAGGAPSPATSAPARQASGTAARRPAVPARRSRHIPLPVRREVLERDGGRCTFVGEDGHRCTEVGLLELHHEQPFGLGGAHGAENVRLLCRAHNGLLAERDYGRDAVRRHRQRRAAVAPAAGADGGATGA